jgi:glutamyl-tRNA synthetase
MVRVRFAPSPTGPLHLGGARTALFNWLFARKHKGVFILRIDDTDVARSKEESVSAIMGALKWLGIDWDEGPYFQSERLGLYKEFAEKLICAQKAYKCFCPPHRLKALQSEGRVYEGDCRRLTKEEIKRLSKRSSYTVRFITPACRVDFKDTVRGRIEFDTTTFGDFIILKSDGRPTYNFATVVDDIQMEITHVIRGDDHISNTPRQLLLYEAFGKSPPLFAHLPMIWGQDKKRLSKRHGAVSVLSYRRAGYLPSALLNYLALLGFSTKESQQIFRREELVEKFSLDRVSKNPAIFDSQKLAWMNAFYIKRLSIPELLSLSLPWLRRRYKKVKREKVLKILPLLRERVKVLSDIVHQADFFFQEAVKVSKESASFILKDEESVKSALKKALPLMERIEDFCAPSLEKELRSLCKREGILPKELFQALRLFLTGRHASPPLFETMEVLGRECVLSRIREGINYIENLSKNC